MNSLRSVRFSFRPVMVVAFAAAMAIASSAAMAQPGGNGGSGRGGRGGGGGFRGGPMGDAMTPPVLTREIDTFSKLLNLNDDQKEAVKTLLEGYQADFQKKADAVRTRMDKAREEFRDTRDAIVFQNLQTSMQELRTARDSIGESFFNDFRAILTPEQVEQWPKVERAHRRIRSVGRGMMSGERVDLVQIVEGAKLPQDTLKALAPTLEEYEVSLDKNLAERNKLYDEAGPRMFQMMRSDPKAAQELIEKGRAASQKVRDLNSRYARLIEDQLPDDRKATFDAAVKEASFPGVYRPSQAIKEIDAALKFTDLDQSQRDSLASLRDSHQRAIDGMNEKIAQEQIKSEENFSVAQMGQRRDPPGLEIRRQKRDADKAASDSIRRILNADQAARLPKPEDDQGDQGGNGDNQGGRGGRGGRGGGQARGASEPGV